MTPTRLVTEAALAAALEAVPGDLIPNPWPHDRKRQAAAIFAAVPDLTEDEIDHAILAETAKRYEGVDWRKEFKPLEDESPPAALPERPALDVEVLARAMAHYRRSGQQSCTVLHTDQFGNPISCPDGPMDEAEAIRAEYERLSRERADG